MGLRVAIDIGGGFTDLFAIDEETGEVFWAKDETTPADYSVGVLNVLRKSRIKPESVSQILHGQTLVINTIVQRRGAKVGLITTKGFRDILHLQRSNRRDIYNLRYRKPEPLIPRRLILEVEERVAYDGRVLKPLNKDDVRMAVERLIASGVQVIAVSYINSYANEEHEKSTGQIIKEVAGGRKIYVALSHEITREWREYERTCTAVLNAYVQPMVDGYLNTLEDKFRKLNVRGPAYVMLSNGGVATFDFASRYPIHTVESGPAAGVVGAIALAQLVGERNIIALDGGSTTTKASLVEGLIPRVTTDYHVGRDAFNAGYPIKVPVIDIIEVGNGGGSIAWIDEAGRLRVGPQSAGADPGPACYGKGGKDPTVTDAYLLVNIFDPNYFLGGELKLKRELAIEAYKSIAEHYGIGVEEAAFGVIRLANDNASLVIRRISVERGYDPRDFTLIAFGGSGPMFSAFIAEELEIPRIIIPSIPPGVFSAWGLLMTDLRHDLLHTAITRLDRPNAIEAVNNVYSLLEAEVLSLFRSEGILDSEKISVVRYADMRYYGQEHVLKVPVMGGMIGQKELSEIVERFHEAHDREYGFRLESPVELVTFHVMGLCIVEKPLLRPIATSGGSPSKAFKGDREVYLGELGFTLVPVYERSMLPAEAVINGPAILEDPTSTSIILANQLAKVDRYGNIHVVRRGD